MIPCFSSDTELRKVRRDVVKLLTQTNLLVSQGGAGTGAGRAQLAVGTQPGAIAYSQGSVLTHVLHFGF